MKNQKGFIQVVLPIVIILVSLVIGASYVGIVKYQDKKNEEQNIEQEKQKQTQELITAQQQALERTKKELDEAIIKSEGATNIAQKASEKVTQLEQKINEPVENPKDLAAIIGQWRPRIGKIICNWRLSNGEHYLTASGSGLIFPGGFGSSSGVWLLTNRHVILDEDVFTPYLCTITIPDENKIFETPFDASKSYKTFSPLDMAAVEVRDPTDHVKKLAASQKTSDLFCKSAPAIGDRVVILGYPGIGTTNDITATEGIVSGLDGDYYITSAKIEHGNSGGVAVLTDKNCVLGIPTFVKVGEIETLGRILSAKAMLNRWGVSF